MKEGEGNGKPHLAQLLPLLPVAGIAVKTHYRDDDDIFGSFPKEAPERKRLGKPATERLPRPGCCASWYAAASTISASASG